MKSRRDRDRVFVRLETGEEVHPSLEAIAAAEGIAGGWVSGIGAASGVELGYYDVERREYDRLRLEGDVEIASASGSLGLVDGRPFVHLHAVVSDRQCVPRAGHLFRAVTAATLEFVILAADGPIERTIDEATGLKLWRL